MSGPSVLCRCNVPVDNRVMEDFTFAILDGLCLLQGSLRRSTPARIWSGTGWLTLETSLTVLDHRGTLVPISDEEAEAFIGRQHNYAAV